jgi:tellurite resistance protein
MTNGQIQNEKAQSRLAFFNHIALKGDPSALPNLFKNALTVRYSGLAGEIGREIYFSSGFDEVKRLKYLFASLELLAGGDVTIEKIESYQVSKPAVEQSIDKIIKAKNLTSKEAQDFNFLLSRFREYFFKLKDFSYVITLCDITMELSKRLNDGVGITLSYSYKGAALFQLKRYQESEKIYEVYFEYTIRSTREVQNFLYPLEGILRNAKESKDLTLYNRAKSDLYEHLIILEKSAIDKELQHSLFDKESAFSKLLVDVPKSEIMVEENLEEDIDKVSTDIIRILVSMAAADGLIDENEKYDLREAAIAISHSLNLSRKVVGNSVEEELNSAVDRSFESTEKIYLESCQNVMIKRSKGYLESVIQLCSDMAMADDTLALSEKKLLDQSRQLLTKE